MKKYLKQSLIIALLFCAITPDVAQAINVSYSDKTKKVSTIIDLKTGTALPFNFTIDGGFEIIPSYSSIVGPLANTSTGDERFSTMTNIQANLGYNFSLLDARTVLGNFNPTFSPYIGYKHFFAYTGTGGLSTSQIQPTTSLYNLGGVNYGLRFTSSIPLGFYVYAEAGATSLLNGSWSQYKPDTSGSLSGGSLFLPNAAVGASFNLFNAFTLRAGYNLRYIPDIRSQTLALTDSSKALVHSFDVGVSFLFFSI